MFDPLTRWRAASLVQQAITGRTIRGVVPIERTGLQLVTEGVRVSIDTVPNGGVVLISETAPARLKGGRGVWPEFVAATDNALHGQVCLAMRFAPSADAIEWSTERARLVTLVDRHGRAAIWLESVDGPARQFPPGVSVVVPPEESFLSDFAPYLERLERSIATHHHESDDQLAIALQTEWPELRTRSRKLLVEHRFDPPVLAAAELEYRYQQARQQALIGARAQTLSERIASERARASRALSALLREEHQATPASEFRQRADALLAAGPHARRGEHTIVVPDLYREEHWIEVSIDPPGASVPEIAERLYGKARKQERGQRARAARREELQARIDGLDRCPLQADQPVTSERLDEIEQALIRLGISAATDQPAWSDRSGRRQQGADASAPRAFRSPSGYEVLVGRNAQQNDRITFRVAEPDDYWFHVKSYGGAHVLLRVAGARDVESRDLVFAAQLAAAHSQAPRGAKVDVHVCRRKHLARPKPGKPGQVLVKRGGTELRVEAVAPPANS
jgi:hypothetical protein